MNENVLMLTKLFKRRNRRNAVEKSYKTRRRQNVLHSQYCCFIIIRNEAICIVVVRIFKVLSLLRLMIMGRMMEGHPYQPAKTARTAKFQHIDLFSKAKISCDIGGLMARR